MHFDRSQEPDSDTLKRSYSADLHAYTDDPNDFSALYIFESERLTQNNAALYQVLGQWITTRVVCTVSEDCWGSLHSLCALLHTAHCRRKLLFSLDTCC